ncbi:MAG TPA: hypothetical protein VMW34_17495 [Anaerolineales bacterium]|nr:hypothetical protein [Anaerolineales bacterium]
MDTEQEHRDRILNMISQEASGFYSIVISVATLFLGGTVFFIGQIAPNPNPYSIILLVLGWVSLIISIIFIALVRRWNFLSGYHYLMDDFSKSKQLDELTRKCSTVSIIALTVGISCISTFGLWNYVQESFFEEDIMGNDGKKHDRRRLEEHSIPFGNIRPSNGSDQQQDSSNSGSDSSGGQNGSTQNGNGTSGGQGGDSSSQDGTSDK